jgi:hypothetical protein
MKIEPFVHRCIVRSGPAEGNKNWHEVTAHEVEYEVDCEECGLPLATVKEIVAHIYDQLTRDT